MKLNKNQEEMQYGIDNYHNWVHVACRRAGKTIGITHVVKNQLYKPNSNVLVFELPSQGANGIFLLLKAIIPDTLISSLCRVTKTITLKNNSIVTVKNGSSKPPTYRDYFRKVDLAAFDEMIDDTYEPYLNDMLLMKTKCLITGTPRSNLLANLVHKGRDVFDTSWGTKSYPYTEIEHFQNKMNEVSEIKKIIGTKAFKIEYEVDIP